jgi:hypothetical protein
MAAAVALDVPFGLVDFIRGARRPPEYRFVTS